MSEQLTTLPENSTLPELALPQVGAGVLNEKLHNATTYISLEDNPLCQPEEIGLASSFDNGEQPTVLGVFNIDDEDQSKVAALIKITDTKTGNTRVAIGGMDRDENGDLMLNNSWVSVAAESTPITIGRFGDADSSDRGDVVGADSLWPGARFSDGVSRKHLTITQKGNIIELTDHSQNGTAYGFGKNAEAGLSDDQADFGHTATHTINAEQLAKMRGLISSTEGQGEKFAGREPISRATTDPEGKVDIRSWVAGGEAIVVDSKKEDSQAYQELLSKCLEKLSGPFTERDLVEAIYSSVQETMNYDGEFADSVSADLKDEYRKVNLGVYLGEGKGVCRHMALACQWLGARMAEKYPLLMEGGAFTTPVNQRTRDNSAHEWARYTSRTGKVYILDPAQQFVGTLEESIDWRRDNNDKWEYFADAEEKKTYMAKIAGDLALKKMTGPNFRKLFKK